MIRQGRAYVAGDADGAALVLTAPLSFWGGVEVETGRIIDASHPQRGESVAGRILVMSSGRGSSSSSSVLAEAIRLGTAPRGIVLASPDPILIVGAIVAHSLYDLECPIVVSPIEGLASGDRLRIRAGAEGEAIVEVSTTER
jgi:predicted aconitase with swiveling domain